MEYKLPKTLTLDYKKWKCGCDGGGIKNRHGVGDTFLLNDQGYMCCLGQFSLQANIPKRHMINKESPADLLANIKGLTNEDIEETTLSQEAIAINDSIYTSIPEKVHNLQQLFKQHGYTIKVKNLPKTYKEELSKLGE